jgi:hypothetical protein
MSFSVLLSPAREQCNRNSIGKPRKQKNAITRIALHAQQYNNDEHEAADCKPFVANLRSPLDVGVFATPRRVQR